MRKMKRRAKYATKQTLPFNRTCFSEREQVQTNTILNFYVYSYTVSRTLHSKLERRVGTNHNESHDSSNALMTNQVLDWKRDR